MPIITVPDSQKLKSLTESKITSVNEDFFDMVDTEEDTGIGRLMSDTLEKEYAPRIKEWMDYYGISNYKADYTKDIPIPVDVYGNLFLHNHKLSKLPTFFEFRDVFGDCTLSNNRFTTMAQFPIHIWGSLIMTGNYITRFDNKITVDGDIVADRQMIRTDYKLTQTNYEKYIKGELNENRVFIEKLNEYGYLESIDNVGLTCKVLLESGKTKQFFTDDVDLIDGLQYIEKLRYMK